MDNFLLSIGLFFVIYSKAIFGGFVVFEKNADIGFLRLFQKKGAIKILKPLY